MLQPKRTKFRKAHKGRIHGMATSGGTTLDFGAVRPEGAGAGARHRAPDRGGAPRAHAPHEARRPRLDPRLPGRAGVEEAARSAHGLGQGRARVLGRRGSSRAASCSRSTACRCSSPRRRSRSRAAKLPIKTRFVAAHRRVGETSMKADDVQRDDRRPARRRAAEAEEGAVQPALPAGDRPAREHRRACARCAATSRASRPSPRRSARPRRRSKERRNAEAHAAGHRGERQARQDRRGPGRAPLHAPGAEEDRAALEEVSRPRRDERVPGRRHVWHRGAPADLEAQALDRGPGREAGEEFRRAQFAQQERGRGAS